jgi:c(7)-type cytochrome triheme protein
MRPQGDLALARDQVVRDRADKGGAFRFVQVTRNPGHVYFSHRAHVSFAKMTCENCHGDVTSWAQPPRAPEPSLVDMDACMACHRKQGASTECQICHR